MTPRFVESVGGLIIPPSHTGMGVGCLPSSKRRRRTTAVQLYNMDRSGLCRGAAFNFGTPTILTVDETVSFLNAVKKELELKSGNEMFVLSIVLKADMGMEPLSPEQFAELLKSLEEDGAGHA